MSKEDVNKKAYLQQSKVNELFLNKQLLVQYKNMVEVRYMVLQIYNDCASKLNLFTQNDQQIKRRDTASGLNYILDNLQFAIKHLNIGTLKDKKQNYYLTYNGIIMIMDICRLLRVSEFSSMTIDHLGFAICSLECSPVLLKIKYLELRVKLYVELSHVYEEVGSNEVSIRTVEVAIKKTNELYSQQEQPLPNYVQKIFQGVYRVLRILEIKYKLQINQSCSETFNFKKKLEKYFSNDKEGRVAAIIESLKFRTYNYVEQSGKALKWKEPALKEAVDIVKPEIEIILEYINQQLIKIEKPLDRNEEVPIKNQKKNVIQISDSRFKEATRCIPLEYHTELCMHAYDVGNISIFEDLSQSADIRSKNRRIETPYITDIEIVVSEHPNPEIKNGYEKIDVDINESQLKILLKKNSVFKQDQPQWQCDNKVGKDLQQSENKQEIIQQQRKQTEVVKGIQHNYTFITIKRSMSPENAICDFQLVLAPEDDHNSAEIKPFIERGYNVQQCPVQQYTGVRETYKKTIYFCFKCTKERLNNEEENKTLLLDIKPVFSNSPLARPDFGYQKIDMDLRQIPYEFIKHPDNDYVYITYKSNEHFSSNERILKLMINLNELEKSFGKVKISTISDQRKIELDINFDVNKLQQIFQTIKDSLEGPLGSKFYQDQKEFLIQLTFYLWKRYIVSQLYQIESIQDMALQQELTTEELGQYMVHVDPLRQIYKTGLKMVNLILVRDPTRSIIWFIKSTMELTKMLMQDEENHEGSQYLKTCYDMVVQFRDEQLIRGVETRKDLFIPYSITADNQKIGHMIEKIKDSFLIFKNEQSCITREKQRNKEFKPFLIKEEQLDELQEFQDLNSQNDTDNKNEKQYFEHFPTENFIGQLDLTINALQVDLITCFYRCYIKHGLKLEKMHKNISSEVYQKKFDKVFKESKDKQNILKNDSLNVGKLPVPQPKLKLYEKTLKMHALKNPYLRAILNMLMAANKKQYGDQKFLLNLSLECIQQAEQMEKQMTESAIADAVYIFSTLMDNKINDQKSSQFPLFDKLYAQEYIPETDRPRTPIFLSRTSTSITVKLPPFNPSVNEIDSSNPGCKDIRSMILYGTVAAEDVRVSTACTDLQSTGIRNEIGCVLQVRQLLNNEGYCFAVAAFNVNEIQSKDIGETTKPIISLQPFPLNQLYAYLALQAYQIGVYDIADLASMKNIEFFTEKSEIQDRFLDQKNLVLFYRIKQSALKNVSSIEINSFAESLFIKARCMQKIRKRDLMINEHKELCLQSNFSLLALEACSVSQQMVLGKRVLLDLYNNIGELVRIKSRNLLQIMIKMYIFMQDIPKQFWDIPLRQLSAKLTYEICVITFHFNQINLGKLVIYQSSQMPNRQYKITPRMIVVVEDSVQSKGTVPQKSRSNIQYSQEDVVQKLVYTLSEQPSYQDQLEDCLLTFSEDYGDLVTGFLENRKEQLDYYSFYVENGLEKVNQLKSQLQVQWTFWEILKEPQTALQKFMASMNQYPCYVEMLCKFARHQIEHYNLQSAKEILAQVEPLISTNIQTLNKIFQLKFLCAQRDIAWNPQILESLKIEKESNRDLQNQAIQIFTEYFQLLDGLSMDKNQMLWRAEFYYLKSITTYLDRCLPVKDNSTDAFYENERLDFESIIDIIKLENEQNRTRNYQEEEFYKDLQNTLALASFFAVESGAEFHLKNIVKLTQNICIREQMSPLNLRGSQASLYSFIIGENMLQIFKTQVQPNLITEITKEFRFNKAEMQPYADFASYVINALLIEEKYCLLLNFCNNFCNATQHCYSNSVIPFMIYAFGVLEHRAQNMTQECVAVMAEKTKIFEEWKNSNNKPKKGASGTDELPQEQVIYILEKETITHKINILKKKQKAITEKKKFAITILDEIKRDANQVMLLNTQGYTQLFECKMGLEKFAQMIKSSSTDQIQKRTSIQTLELLKQKYKSVIDLAKLRKDNTLQIKALSQYGDLQFSQGQVSEAEQIWNDALDVTLKKLHALEQQKKLQYDKISQENCLTACVFLYKLAKNCYFSNMYMQKKSLIVAGALSFQIFKSQMVNPQTLIGFADTLAVLLPFDLFNQNLGPITTVQATDFLIQGLIDNEMHIKALPLIQIMDHIANKVCYSDFFSTRSKLFKCIVLSKIGMINQAYQMLLQVQSDKCGPIPLLQQSESLSLQKGSNWFSPNKDFINSSQYFQQQNKEVIKIIVELNLNPQFDQKHSILNNFLFQYAKIKLLFCIHEQEIIDRPEFAEPRIKIITDLETETRKLLLQIQRSEDMNISDYANQGSLTKYEARAERLALIYRARFLLANMLIALGLNTRAYFVLKTGLDVMQNHVFELPNAETGRELQNQNLMFESKDNKNDKKQGISPEKLKEKDANTVEEVTILNQQFEYNYETLQNKKKRKHLNGFWYNKFKISIANIFFSQNRFENCHALLKKIKNDSLIINDKFTIKLAEELEARVFIRQGKITEGILKLQDCVSKISSHDNNSGRMYGDLGDLLFEKNQYEQASELFQQACNVFHAQKDEFKFDFQHPINKKPEQEKIKINEKYVFPIDTMEQLSKKEAKIRKDDKKGGKEVYKKEEGKDLTESKGLKVIPLNPLQMQNLTQVQKPQLKDYILETAQQLSIYISFLEDYIRANLRLIKCRLALDQLQDLEHNFDKLELYISGNFNLPLSFKVEFYFLQALTYKRLFVFELQEVSKHYIEQYKTQQNKKYKKLHDRQPVRDLPRNKYMQELPNFSHHLKKKLKPEYLDKSKKIFIKAMEIIKGECIFYEGDLKIDQILMEMADVTLLQREYWPRFGFKYIQQEEDQKLTLLEGNNQVNLNLEYECSQIITYAISVVVCKKEILQTSLGNVNVPDPSKIPVDLTEEILESDFIYKKKYEPMLFDETKDRKTVVNSLDLVYLLNKLQRESKIMTFSGNKAQKTILKIHRFLKTYHSQYIAKCTISDYDIKSTKTIEDGKFWFKSIACQVQKEYKFIYVLSRFTISKLVTNITKEELDKLLLLDDKEVLYGNFYISSADLSNLEIQVHNLRSQFLDSQQKENSIKKRDLDILGKKYLEIFNFFGKLFNKKNISETKNGIHQEYEISKDRNVDFVPPFNLQNIDIFVKMLGPEGVEADVNNPYNHNLLLLLRNYHKSKYR